MAVSKFNLVPKASCCCFHLAAAATLAGLDAAGRAWVAWAGWPVPGSLMGLGLLWAGLAAWGRVPEALNAVAAPLQRHLILWFLPGIAAVVEHGPPLARQAPALLVATVLPTLLTAAASLAVLRRRLTNGPTP